MSRQLDIDERIELWYPALKAVVNGESVTCPRCGNSDVDVTIENFGEGIGYVVVTCNKCKKSGYFSRVAFNTDIKQSIIKNDKPSKVSAF